MLKDNWEEKHGINIPIHTSFSKGFPGTPVSNMILQPLQGYSHNDHPSGSSSRTNGAAFTSSTERSILPSSNLQSVDQLASMEPVSFRHQSDNQFHQQSNLSETKPTATEALVGSNVQDLIKFLSANYGPMNTPLEVGTPEYLKLVEILQQSARGNSGEEDMSSISVDSQDTITGNGVKKDFVLDPPKIDEHSQKDTHESAEKLWEGSLQLSSSVTLSAVTFFKSGEKLVGNDWPEFIEVKGKVRLEAFEKYVQDLPRSRNRGLMVISVYWNEKSSNIGLAGMKEVAKGYKKSSRVGFANLSSGVDLYICPRSDPVITILAKYGFFKGMTVIDDNPDSMIGCVVWRKNRPVNPVGNTSEGKSSPDSIQLLNSPPGFSIRQQCSAKKRSPETSQYDQPLTLPFTEIDPLWNYSVSSDPSNNLVKKRSFVDDDLPEFDFGVSSQKSTLVSQQPNPPSQKSTLVSQQPTQFPLVNNGSVEQSSKKIKLFEDDDDDMPEWCPPKMPSQNFQTLPSLPLPPPPPLRPIPPPPPRADAHSSFSYQPFRPAISSLLPTFAGPPPLPPMPPPPPPPPLPFNSSGGLNSNQASWHQPSSFNVNLPFPPSNGRHSQP